MTPALNEPEELVALGAFLGAQVLVVCLSVVNANVYRERAFLMLAGAGLIAVLVLQSLTDVQPFHPEALLLVVLALAGLELVDLVSHAGAIRHPRRWLVAASLLLPALALGAVWSPWVLLPSLAIWLAVVLVMLLRAWPQSQPWIVWLLPGVGALIAAAVLVARRSALSPDNVALAVGALFALWSGCTFVATAWRSRIFGETRARIDARTTVDPLTGLSTPLVLAERIRAARSLMQRYGHPSVLLLVHIENLQRLAQEFGPEVGESAVLSAANRIRQALRDGDVAARLAHSRIAVLVEGMPVAEGAANVASRILVAGLKEPLAAAPAEFLHFRVVLAPVPVNEIPAKTLLARMAAAMDRELHERSQRRIVTLAGEEIGGPEAAAPAPQS